ncbi:spore germination protein KC [Paenibacillus castaneae]|uniref:Ger(x)C family spore germination protein n=1 Tax=Paenibacillus castaneae TaxID=474957 RepID=UPI000C9B7F4B|nr:Ger(x)C family spore germination protein [Paenibacillus castaneae]NIK79404.1 spore germination protein KC [Paenibacillus castaneae]
MSGRQSDGNDELLMKIVRTSILLWMSCILLFLSGCWDLRYLDKLGVVLAMGIDEDLSGKQKLQLTVQVVLTQNVAALSKGGGGGESPVTTYTDTGDTIFEAIRKMSAKTSRRLFFSHTQMLLISEGMSRKGIYPLLDLIERNPDIRTNISVAVTRGSTAKELLQVKTQMEAIPVIQILDMIEINQESYGMNYPVYVKDLIKTAGRGLMQASVPTVRMEGDKAKSNTSDNTSTIPAGAIPALTTMAVFRDGKLVEFLKPKESRGLSWLQGKVKNTVVKLACPESEGYLIVEVSNAHNRTTVRNVKGMPVVDITLSLIGNLQEITCPGIDVADEKAMDRIGMMTSEAVKQEAEAVINILQKKAKTDALGWAKEIYIHQPSLWRRIVPNWETEFPKVKHEIKCTTKINGSGIRSRSIVK